MTPRQLTAQHLPELAETWDELRTTFTAKLVWLHTPEGSAGARPDWLDWPSHTAAEMGEPWIPVSRGGHR